MTSSKTVTLALADYGSYLGREKGCFIVKDQHGTLNEIRYLKRRWGKLF
jgi:hypothetical protein